MDIKLAGFNVDIDGIREIKALLEQDTLSDEDRKTALYLVNNLTPETISAAYARISRDPRPLYELRKDGRNDVESARKSNKAIIFTMGHKSVAEHAVFNFDVMGISRRAVEEVEEKRLQSYTEKSQRYITLDGDFILPKEIIGTKFESRFLKLVEMQNDFYQRNLHKLIEWHKQRQNDYSDLFNSLCIKSEDEARKLGTLEGLGKEDARYALGQATQAQIGLTVSARNLEVLITKLRSSSIAEFQEIGEELFKEIDGVAPSVIKYTNPSDYFAKTRKELREHVSKIPIFNERAFSKIGADVLLHTNLHRDYSITSGLIFSSSDISYTAALFLVNNVLNKNNLIELLDIADKYQQAHDPKLREYELGDRIAEITLSASAFAQLKRHRMDTLIPQRYNPSLGWTTPDSIMGTKIADDLEVITNASSALYKDMLASDVPFEVADYALTNAHRRRVLFDSNNRQVHAFCMERENLPAQWDIRRLANQYHELLQQESPLTLRNLTGKDKFYEVKQNQQSK